MASSPIRYGIIGAGVIANYMSRAFTEGRTTLFYDLKEMRPYLLKALEISKRPDMHMWFNRFPPIRSFSNSTNAPWTFAFPPMQTARFLLMSTISSN